MRDHSGFGWLALIVSILLVLLGIATFICQRRRSRAL